MHSSHEAPSGMGISLYQCIFLQKNNLKIANSGNCISHLNVTSLCLILQRKVAVCDKKSIVRVVAGAVAGSSLVYCATSDTNSGTLSIISSNQFIFVFFFLGRK